MAHDFRMLSCRNQETRRNAVNISALGTIPLLTPYPPQVKLISA
jgi:hypothetical protein